MELAVGGLGLPLGLLLLACGKKRRPLSKKGPTKSSSTSEAPPPTPLRGIEWEIHARGPAKAPHSGIKLWPGPLPPTPPPAPAVPEAKTEPTAGGPSVVSAADQRTSLETLAPLGFDKLAAIKRGLQVGRKDPEYATLAFIPPQFPRDPANPVPPPTRPSRSAKRRTHRLRLADQHRNLRNRPR